MRGDSHNRLLQAAIKLTGLLEAAMIGMLRCELLKDN